MAESKAAIADNPLADPPEFKVTGRESHNPRICEDSKDGHLVKVKLWPPKQRYAATKRMPSVAGACEKCGAHVIVYEQIQPGLTVVLPDGKRLRGEGPKAS